MERVLRELNFDFNYYVYLFNECVVNLRVEEQSMAIAWINKLKRVSATVEEAQLRNDFLLYLVKHCQQGHLNVPFREKPPAGPLTNVLSLMPGTRPKLKKPKKKLEEKCDDKVPESSGAFLTAQPIPRCGAFCYLAVISRKPKTEE